MGQFHTDFGLKGAVGEIYSEESYFLGKKVYLDCLVGTDKHGDTLRGAHIRMKGVCEAAVHHAAWQGGDGLNAFGSTDPVLGLYKRLYEGQPATFDLTVDGTRCTFKYQKDLSCKRCKAGEFTRTLSFKQGGSPTEETG